MSWLKNWAPTGFSETCKDLAVVALLTLLASFIKRKCIAVQVKLSMMIHSLTWSCEAMGMLRTFSLMISYQEVLDLHAVWSELEMESYDSCQEELTKTTLLKILENNDFQDDILTGTCTSNCRNIRFIERQANEVFTENHATITMAMPSEMAMYRSMWDSGLQDLQMWMSSCSSQNYYQPCKLKKK